jgi:hypothetical protein
VWVETCLCKKPLQPIVCCVDGNKYIQYITTEPESGNTVAHSSVSYVPDISFVHKVISLTFTNNNSTEVWFMNESLVIE